MSEEEKKQKIKEYQKQYKKDHKEQHRQYMNDYVKKSPAILCACGGRFHQYSGYKHNQTKKHVRFLCDVLENSEKPPTVEEKPIEVNLDELEIKALGDLENPKLKLNKESMFVVINGEPEELQIKIKKPKKPSKSVPIPKTEIHNVVA